MFFGVAAVVSVWTLIQKGKLLVAKVRLRHQSVQDDGPKAGHDAAWRQQWIATMDSAPQSYTEAEKSAIAQALKTLGAFAVPPGTTRTKFDAQSKRLIGATTCTIPSVGPDQVAAYLMHADSHAIRGTLDPNVQVRFDVLERASSHQVIIFSELKTAPFQNRTFLNLSVCQKLSANVWLWVTVPLSSHARIGPHDELHAVRAEAMRCCRMTAASDSESCLLEYACWLDLKGSFPAWFNNHVALPNVLNLPKQIRSCFGRILDAETIEKLDENKLELHKLYCLLALGFAEDLPMTFLSGYYLVRDCAWPTQFE